MHDAASQKTMRPTEQRVLVRSGHIFKLLRLAVIANPAPAGALNRSRLCVKFLLEVLEPTKVTVDRVVERARLKLATSPSGGSEILPEEGVVDVTFAGKE